jgi:hypothetical protein
LTLLIKGFNEDVKQKAAIFDDAVLKKFMVSRRNNAYWLVRQSICIVSFFGGLRHQECMDLELEKIQNRKARRATSSLTRGSSSAVTSWRAG